MMQKRIFRLILFTGVLLTSVCSMRIDLCSNSSGIIGHVSNNKFVRQWVFVGKGCETPGSSLLLTLNRMNLTCDAGAMLLGISAFDNIPNLCSFRRPGYCFFISSSSNSSSGCIYQQKKIRDNVLPVAIVISKTAGDVYRGFEIRYEFMPGNVSSELPLTTQLPIAVQTASSVPKFNGLKSTTTDTIAMNTTPSPATSVTHEVSSLNVHAKTNATIYFSLTIAFGILLIITLLTLTAQTVRSRSTGNSDANSLEKC